MKEKINKFHLYLQNVSTIKFILIMEIFLSFMMLSIFPFYHISIADRCSKKQIIYNKFSSRKQFHNCSDRCSNNSTIMCYLN